MYTQITCPNCRTPYTVEVHQLIDVGQHPELKSRLLSGQLNVAVCPSCGAGGQLSAPLLYHDPAHDLFMLYVPQELNINQVEREQIIGQLTKQAMDATPPEKRRAYMFQPQQVLSMQTFIEKVLETEGITKEMIERQRKQSELLRTLAQADKDVQEYLIKERMGEIDETFFAMLDQAIEQIMQIDPNQTVPFVNLRARLMTETPVGRELERQQIALHKLNRDAKKAGGLSPQLLVKHVLANQEDDKLVDAIVQAGQGALTYEFFQLLTAEIEDKEAAGDETAVSRLTNIRTRLLDLFEARQKQSQQMLKAADDLLQAIVQAPDKQQAIQENMGQIDDLFMYMLQMRLAQAEQDGEQATANALNEIQSLIVKEMESQLPPEVVLLNRLIEADSEEKQQTVLDAHKELVSPDVVRLIDAVMKQGAEGEAGEMVARLASAKKLIEAMLAVTGG
ncbi:MAG: CpXC domain-containing protein [Candidatus Promineifilaceae bacterium]